MRSASLLSNSLFLLLALVVPSGAAETEAAAESEAAATTKEQAAPEAPKPITTRSGLIYTEVVRGTGTRPKPTSVVEVHYHGTFADGKVFDSSVERNKPAQFPLNRVIKCWTEGLQKMKVGGRSTLVCPPQIAYGARGRPPGIPPNATLTFEVELLEIVR
jgi:FKBP-type peptidyl-prolyl cis-trans isomerase FkpA